VAIAVSVVLKAFAAVATDVLVDVV
jgi:hypothetical protein